MNRALILGLPSELNSAIATQLVGLGLEVQTLPALSAALDGGGASVVLCCDLSAEQCPSRADLVAQGSGTAILLAIGEQAAVTPGLDGSLPIPWAESDLIRALVAAGYQIPSASEYVQIGPALLQFMGGDESIVVELVNSLIATGQADIADYLSACGKGNWNEARARAHRLTGTARMTGCKSVVKLCEHVERVAEQGDEATAIALNTLLVPTVERLCVALRSAAPAS